MAKQDDYVTTMHELSEMYTNLMLENFSYYLKIYGTDIIVKRATNDEYRDALGSAYVFDGTSLEHPPEVFKKRIVINRSQLLELYRTTINDLDAWFNEDFFQIGDQIEFMIRGYQVKYKVSNIERFDPYGTVKLFKITLAGFEEFKQQ